MIQPRPPSLGEPYIHLILALSLQDCSLSLAVVLRYVTERLRSSDLVGFSITAVVDLLQRWIVPLNGEGVAMLLAMVFHIRNCHSSTLKELLTGMRHGVASHLAI